MMAANNRNPFQPVSLLQCARRWGRPREKRKTVVSRTNLILGNWPAKSCGEMTGKAAENKIADGIRRIFERLFGMGSATLSVRVWLATSDRRKPAYVQLRAVWNTLDSQAQKEAVDWILQRAMIDPLSGLETLVAKDISGQKPAGWVDASSDLNALKAINDTWGHEAGDKVISELGMVVKAEVAKEGGRAFRVGGDEISYWFPNAAVAQRALAAIDARFQAEAFVIGGNRRRGFSVSYGIGPDAASADNALYLDKTRRISLGQRAERGQLPKSIDQQPCDPRMAR